MEDHDAQNKMAKKKKRKTFQQHHKLRHCPYETVVFSQTFFFFFPFSILMSELGELHWLVMKRTATVALTLCNTPGSGM